MKKLVCILFTIACVTFSFTSDTLKTMLSEVFPNQQVETILEDKELTKYYSNLFFNSYHIEVIPENKPIGNDIKTLSFIEYNNVDGTSVKLSPEEFLAKIKDNSFNILRTKLARDYKNTTFFRIGKTRSLLVLISYSQLTKLQSK